MEDEIIHLIIIAMLGFLVGIEVRKMMS